jgi:hypothetical protein
MNLDHLRGIDPLAVLSALAAEALPVLLGNGDAEEKNAMLARIVPDALAAFGALQESKRKDQRTDFVAHHAVVLCQTVVETTADDDALKDAAKRAVRLSGLIWDLAGK